MTTQAKVEAALYSHIAGAQVDLETGPSGKVFGWVVSSTFFGQEDKLRVARVWTALREAIAPEDLEDVTMIFPVTPEEAQSIREDQQAS